MPNCQGIRGTDEQNCVGLCQADGENSVVDNFVVEAYLSRTSVRKRSSGMWDEERGDEDWGEGLGRRLFEVKVSWYAGRGRGMGRDEDLQGNMCVWID